MHKLSEYCQVRREIKDTDQAGVR